MTPTDDYVFIGEPPLIRPEVDEVHISCSFTWDLVRAHQLVKAWGQYYPIVKQGGMVCQNDSFTPGMYIRHGVIFTSRGCNNQCPWCLVLEREGKLREIEIKAGNMVQDNNLLQCNHEHIGRVFEMLRSQHSIQFTGGLDSRLLTDDLADQIRSLRVKQVFFAADTKHSLKPLEKAIKQLALPRNKIRCYALLAFDNESISDCLERLETIWKVGAMPFAQLYQPPERYIRYSKEWRDLARTWSRPAAMKSLHRELV
jgi:organic radical activating enzyme